MPVIGSAGECRDSPDGNWSWDKQRFRRSFLVQTTSYSDGPLVAMTAPGLPAIGDYYATANESHPWAICRDIDPKRIAPRSLTWRVDCTFETISRSTNGRDITQEQQSRENPLLEIPDIKLKPEIFQEPVWGTIDPDTNTTDPSKPLTNSAGELFDPPFMMDATRMVLTIARNESLISAPAVVTASLLYQNAINSDVFWGADPHLAKILPFEIDRQSRSVGSTGQLQVFLRVTYTIVFKWPRWDLRPLDNGGNYLDASTGKLREFIGIKGHPYRGLLNGLGRPLGGVDSRGEAIPISPGTTANYLLYQQIYRELPFAALSLPTSFLG